MPSRPAITTLVLTWNSAAFITDCIDSLRASTIPTRIVVVDNDSADDTRALLAERYPDITVVNTGANLGYAGGNNIGIRQALHDGADYVFIINPDATIDPHCIEQLHARLQQEPTLGGVSPKIYFHGTDRLWFGGSTIDWRTGVTRQIGGPDTGQYDTERYTERLNGCAMMLPASTLDTVGLMDERYFLYYEESDWSVMAARKGFKLGFVASAKAWHENSSSTGGHLSPLYQYYMTRNRLYFMKKFKPSALPRVLFLVIWSGMESTYVAYRDVNIRRAYVVMKSILKACFDFCAGRMGRRAIPE